MLIKELFDSGVKFKVTEQSKVEYTCTATINEREIEFHAYVEDSNPDFWFIEFSEMQDDGWTRNFDMTGSGKELQVLGMVKDALLEFIKKYHPKTFAFSADKSGAGSASRTGTYERMVKRFKVPGYTFSKQEKDHKDIFKFEKN